LEVSQTGGVQKIAKLQTPIVASLDVCFHIASVDLRKDEPRSCTSHNIKGEFTKKGIYRGPLYGIEERNIPIGTHPKFHH
jgi:hypothetical protein